MSLKQSSQTTFLENQNIKLDIEKKPGCQVIFSITTLPLATKAAHQAALKAVAKEVNIPGFRKGKAPEALIVQKFSPQVKQEFLDILTRNSLNEAIQLSKIRPLSQKSGLKLVKCDPIDDTSYLVVVELEAYPELPVIAPDALSIAPASEEPVTAEQIQAHIDQLQLHHAEWEEILDKKAQDGDFVTLKIDLLNEDGTTRTVHEKGRFQLKDKKLPSWLKKLTEGLSIGESATGTSEADDGEEEGFKPRTFTVMLQKIELPKLPPLDEALAKKAGVDSVELLHEAIRKSLEKDAAIQAKQKNRLAIRKALLNAYPFDIPAKRLDEAHQECHEIAESNDHMSKDEQHQYAHQLFDTAKDNIRFSYLIPHLFHHNHLSYPDQQTIRQRATEEMVMRYMKGDQSITDNDLDRYTRTAENEIIAETALDFLLEKSKKA